VLDINNLVASGPKSLQTIWIMPPAEDPTFAFVNIPQRSSPFLTKMFESSGHAHPLNLSDGLL